MPDILQKRTLDEIGKEITQKIVGASTKGEFCTLLVVTDIEPGLLGFIKNELESLYYWVHISDTDSGKLLFIWWDAWIWQTSYGYKVPRVKLTLKQKIKKLFGKETTIEIPRSKVFGLVYAPWSYDRSSANSKKNHTSERIAEENDARIDTSNPNRRIFSTTITRADAICFDSLYIKTYFEKNGFDVTILHSFEDNAHAFNVTLFW